MLVRVPYQGNSFMHSCCFVSSLVGKVVRMEKSSVILVAPYSIVRRDDLDVGRLAIAIPRVWEAVS